MFNSLCFCPKKLAQDIHNEEKSLYEIQQDFENYWENKTIGKGKGWKTFLKEEKLSWSQESSPQVIFLMKNYISSTTN